VKIQRHPMASVRAACSSFGNQFDHCTRYAVG
jgi:hypothetical protein